MVVFMKLNGTRGLAMLIGFTAYLFAVLIYTLGTYPATPTPQSLTEYCNLVRYEHSTFELWVHYLTDIGFRGLIGLMPAGVWLVQLAWKPFLFFIVSVRMVTWIRENFEFGLPFWFVVLMHFVGGFPIVCYFLQSTPNRYELAGYLLASLLALFTYHFLIIILVGKVLQGLAKDVLRFFGIKVEA
jgi:hypothetical protein